jgi:DNA-binding response OmpR family regulator
MTAILVVDDEEGVREFVAEALEADGHQTLAVGSAEAALAELSRRQYSLMLTDLRMPGMDGLALLARARALQPELEVILLTAHGSVDAAVEAMKLGAFDFIQKPVSSPAELRLLAARALERHSLLALKESAARDGEQEPSLSYGDPSMKAVVEALQKVARTNATVLLAGESGTGKEVAARAVHRWSQRGEHGSWQHRGRETCASCAMPWNAPRSSPTGHGSAPSTSCSMRRPPALRRCPARSRSSSVARSSRRSRRSATIASSAPSASASVFARSMRSSSVTASSESFRRR